ncbi:hypothetical protein BTO09_06805 [Gilvibacter sp. SZ-19]|uniref:nuclear transport factor 2 family protein n=1 Tax=Gilvibacter sp. SZ-19 TaxID=754429 RepID=UPI000B3CD908|nr:nuclear transport factor 2 family protein [Gilvibacter sp. SZ-19]ARV12077.1 hypothetical protein BTO09_06805 [Gilvibacter sp. SZ-19]
MKKLLFLFAFCLTTISFAQDYKKDLDDVIAASEGYIDIFYKGDTALAYTYIDKSLRKVGWRFNEEKKAYSGNRELPFEAVIDLSKRLKERPIPKDAQAIREVEVLEVNDKIAITKVTASWGIDYLNLVKKDGAWKIINIVWQSAPQWTYRPED